MSIIGRPYDLIDLKLTSIILNGWHQVVIYPRDSQSCDLLTPPTLFELMTWCLVLRKIRELSGFTNYNHCMKPILTVMVQSFIIFDLNWHWLNDKLRLIAVKKQMNNVQWLNFHLDQSRPKNDSKFNYWNEFEINWQIIKRRITFSKLNTVKSERNDLFFRLGLDLFTTRIAKELSKKKFHKIL